MGAPYVSASVEKACNVHRLQRAKGASCYCVLTDANLVLAPRLEPGQFHYVIFGVVAVANNVFTVVGYSNVKEGDDFELMLDVLRKIDLEVRPPKGA